MRRSPDSDLGRGRDRVLGEAGEQAGTKHQQQDDGELDADRIGERRWYAARLNRQVKRPECRDPESQPCLLQSDERAAANSGKPGRRSEEHTSELQSHSDLVCRLLLEKKKKNK